MAVMFDINKIKNLKNKKDERLQKMIEEALKIAENALDITEIDESFADDNDNLLKNQPQHGNYYEASVPFKNNILFLGFAYHYTGDRKYFDKAKKLMLLYAQYKKWHGSGFFGQSELNNAHFNFGMACGYDIFYDELTDGEKRIIIDGTYKNGIKPTIEDWINPKTRIHALDSMGHNWWIVCVSMAGFAAVIMKRDMPSLEKDYKMAVEAAKKWFSYQGNEYHMRTKNIDNGAFYEGVSYMNFSIFKYTFFKMAVKKVTGNEIFDDNEVIQKMTEFLCNTLYYKKDAPTHIYFGDCGEVGLMLCTKILLSAGYDIPLMKWYISQWKEAPITIYDILFYDEIYCGEMKEYTNTMAVYKDIGWGIFRNEDFSSMLAIKCGDTWNHSHSDAASFLYYDDGEEIIGEGGTCGYGEKEYIEYFCSSYAHNTILFEGKGQDARDITTHTRLRGRLFDEYKGNNIKSICADATGPMSRFFRRFIRSFVWIDDFILIYDDIEAYEQGNVQFLIHEKKAGYFKMLTDCKKNTLIGYKDHNNKETEEYYSYEKMTDDDCRNKFISILGKNYESFEMVKKDNTYVISGGSRKIYINELSDGRMVNENCNNTMGGFETDAILLVISEDEIFFINASFIRQGEKVFYSEFEKTTGIISLKDIRGEKKC